MSSILTPSRNIRFPEQLIVTASAGSGKTTTLTQRYVQFLLSENLPATAPKNILAITFTNNAANEMKERILRMLKEIALGIPTAVEPMAELTGLTPDRLRIAAERALESVFSNYSEFQVRTIDSFLANVFKAMAVEFGFPPDYRLDLSSGALFERAFRDYSARVAADPKQMALLRELVELTDEYRSDKDSYTWNPYATIARKVRELYRESAKEPQAVHVPELDNEQRKAEERLHKSATALKKFADSASVGINSHLLKDINEVLAGGTFAVIGRTEKTKVFNAGKNKAENEFVEKHSGKADDLLGAYNRALHDVGILRVRRMFAPFARTLHLLDSTLHEIKRREATVLLDDVYRLLGDTLTQQIIPDIYVKLGDRIHHYLIDEFQDTSPIQYKALYPLWEEALSKNGSLFVVGDTKQSIYGFRGADYRIMRRMIGTNQFHSADNTVKTLDRNYRSRNEIVAFNRELFRTNLPTHEELAEAAHASGLSIDEQEPGPENKPPGRVRVFPILRDTEQEPELAQIAAIIQDWHDNGYAWRDIAVLTAANAGVVRISSTLNARGIPFISESSLDIRNRKVIGELLALFRFLDSPVDNVAFATFILSDVFTRASGLAVADVREFLIRNAQRKGGSAIYTAFRDAYPEAWRATIEPLFARTGHLPLYDLVAEAMDRLKVFVSFPKEEASLVRFLETAREAESEGKNGVGNLVNAADDEGGLSWELPSLQGHDAVRIMTVHKAKGLGHPCVCVLTYPRKERISQPVAVETDEGRLELWHLTKDVAEKYPEFADEYRKVRERRQVNDLNALYVSLTRAKAELAVVSAYEDEEDIPHTLYPTTAEAPPPQVEHDQFDAKANAERVHAGGLHSQIEPPEGPLHDRETTRGDVIHAVLAEIGTLDSDPTSAIAAAVTKVHPEVDGFDPADIASRIRSFVDMKELHDLFDARPGRRVFAEQEIVAPDGRLSRIDRLVVDSDNITIVDFKTGGRESEKDYFEQVKRYIRLVSEAMPGKPVTGVLAYVDAHVVVEVA